MAVAELAVALERALLGADGGIDLVREVALLRVQLEQAGQLGRRQLAGEAQRARVLRSRLAVRALRGGTRARGLGVAERRGAIARGIGVVGELREIRRDALGRPVERPRARGGGA